MTKCRKGLFFWRSFWFRCSICLQELPCSLPSDGSTTLPGLSGRNCLQFHFTKRWLWQNQELPETLHLSVRGPYWEEGDDVHGLDEETSPDHLAEWEQVGNVEETQSLSNKSSLNQGGSPTGASKTSASPQLGSRQREEGVPEATICWEVVMCP